MRGGVETRRRPVDGRSLRHRQSPPRHGPLPHRRACPCGQGTEMVCRPDTQLPSRHSPTGAGLPRPLRDPRAHILLGPHGAALDRDDARRPVHRALVPGGAHGARAVVDRAAVATVAGREPAADQACGAAAVAGFLKTVALLKPTGLRVVAEIGAVRNSIGSDAFVPDEIITSHAGVRVRIGNTDAEGRLVLADLLSHLREDAKTAVNPTLYSIATLTGHAARAVGPYSALVENGAARRLGLSADLAMVGDLWADPSEISRSRREDFSFIKGRTSADDLLSCNNAPSSVTPRGHQFPMAFLVAAAGLDQHGVNTEQPLPYCHIDIAGSGVDGGDWQHGKPSAAPVAALAAYYCL